VQRYDVKRFLREAPTDLLREFLATQDLEGHLDWSAPRQQLVHDIFSAIASAPVALYRHIHCTFRAVHQLADADGANTLAAEMDRRRVGRKTIESFTEYPTPLGQAFWAYLHHPDLFAVSRLFRSADLLPRWHRSCVPPATPLPPEEATRRLRDDLRAYYKENQDRGYGGEVQRHPRDTRCYWFACLQDYPKEVRLYDDDRQLQTATLELGFAIIFVYDQQAGTLAIACKGNLEHTLDLQRLFGRAVLNVELPRDGAGEVYHLQRLLDPALPLPLTPEDQVEAVHVQYIGIEFLGQRRRSITVNTGSSGETDGVHEMIDRVVSGFHVPRDLLTVTQIGLHLTVRASAGRPPVSQVIHLTPQYCSCTEGPLGEDLRQLLRRWGIYDRADCDPAAPSD
jgi:hypothetical protein